MAMGNRFLSVVLFCLGAIEEQTRTATPRGTAAALAEERIGLQYIDSVLSQLEGIQL